MYLSAIHTFHSTFDTTHPSFVEYMNMGDGRCEKLAVDKLPNIAIELGEE